MQTFCLLSSQIYHLQLFVQSCTCNFWLQLVTSGSTTHCNYRGKIFVNIGHVGKDLYKVQKQGGNESTLGYPATKDGKKERQGRPHYIHCKNVPCSRYGVVFLVFLLHHLW